MIRNLALERIAEDLNLTVRCNIEDCDHECNISQLEKHRKTCPRRKLTCPIGGADCDTYTIGTLSTHVCSHRKNVIEVSEKMSTINLMIATASEWSRTFVYMNQVIVMAIRSCQHKFAFYAHVLGNRTHNSGVLLRVRANDSFSETYEEFGCELVSTYMPHDVKPLITISGFDMYIQPEDNIQNDEILLLTTQKTLSNAQILKKSPYEIKQARLKFDEIIYNERRGIEVLHLCIELKTIDTLTEEKK